MPTNARPKPMPNYGRVDSERVKRKADKPLPLATLVKAAGFVHSLHRKPVVVLEDGTTWG